MVEFTSIRQSELDSLYQEYKKSNYNLSHYESEQLGFQIGKIIKTTVLQLTPIHRIIMNIKLLIGKGIC
jgi:hypothetical protein